MTTSNEWAMVDTNVLIYAMLPQAEQYEPSRKLLEQAYRRQVHLVVTHQILLEFYAVATSSRQMNRPRSSTDAVLTIRNLMMLPGLSLLPPGSDLLNRWFHLIQLYPVSGARVFDLQIVATMLSYGITDIYTYDKHFQSISQINRLLPPD